MEQVCEAIRHVAKSKFESCNVYGCSEKPTVELRIGGGNMIILNLLCLEHAATLKRSMNNLPVRGKGQQVLTLLYPRGHHGKP